MLLSLRDQLRIDLRPDWVTLVRQRGLLRKKVVSQQIQPCEDAASGEAPWEPALRAMQAGVAALGGGQFDATVVLSNHFVRYALLPAGDQLSNDSEEQAYTRHGFTRIYGDDAENWVLRLSTHSPGEMQVASAVDHGLLEGLERVAGASGLRLCSIQPGLMNVFNHWRRRLLGDAVWFLLAEPGRLCIARLKHGRWRSLRSMKIDQDWLTRLPQLLERELRLSDSGAERGKVFLIAPEVANEAEFPASEWTVEWLKDTPDQPASSRRALAGALLEGG